MRDKWLVQEAYNLLETINFEESGWKPGDHVQLCRGDRKHNFLVEKDGFRHMGSHASRGLTVPSLGLLAEAFNRKAALMIASVAGMN